MAIIDASNPLDAEEIGNQVEYTLSNGEELYNFLFANPSVLEQVANLISMHWDNPNMMSLLVRHQIFNDLNEIKIIVKPSSYLIFWIDLQILSER